MASQGVIARISQMMQSRNVNEYSDALLCISAFSSTDCSNVMMWAIMGGLFVNLLEILNLGSSEDKIRALYTLSNVSGSENK